MFVRAAEGRTVRRPDTLALLLPDGEEVPDTDFWFRRLSEGDVEFVKLAETAKPFAAVDADAEPKAEPEAEEATQGEPPAPEKAEGPAEPGGSRGHEGDPE